MIVLGHRSKNEASSVTEGKDLESNASQVGGMGVAFVRAAFNSEHGRTMLEMGIGRFPYHFGSMSFRSTSSLCNTAR